MYCYSRSNTTLCDHCVGADYYGNVEIDCFHWFKALYNFPSFSSCYDTLCTTRSYMPCCNFDVILVWPGLDDCPAGD